VNWLDIVLCLILLVSIYAGLVRGFTRTVIGIVTTILAIVLAIWFHGAAGALFSDWVSHKTVANFLGFCIVFGVTMLAGALVGHLIARTLKFVGLGWLDRLMGGALGFVRAALIAAVLIMILCAFTRTPPPQSVAQSRLAPYMMEVANVLSYLAPRELKEGFQSSYEKVKQVWRKVLQAAPERL